MLWYNKQIIYEMFSMFFCCAGPIIIIIIIIIISINNVFRG